MVFYAHTAANCFLSHLCRYAVHAMWHEHELKINHADGKGFRFSIVVCRTAADTFIMRSSIAALNSLESGGLYRVFRNAIWR